MPRRPDIAQAIERIGKYAGGDDWREHRHAHLEAMLGRLLAQYDLELQACFDEVTELGQAETLVGFLHESFLAAEFGPEKANVIDEFLARRGWQQTPRAREYLQGIRTTPVSLYEVHDVAPGEWVELRDLYRAGPPRRIAEESGSRTLQRWDRLAARVVIAREEELLTGGILWLDRESAEALEGKRRRTDEVFLQVWLKCLLDSRRRPLPSLANTDGEPLVLTRTRLPVAAHATGEVTRRLDALIGWQRETDDESPAWTWQPAGGTPATTHATAKLERGSLIVETNSRARMERALVSLRGALGTLIGQALTSHEDPMQLLQLPQLPQLPQDPLPAGPAIEATMRQFKDAHYRRVLDEPVPMLGDKTPRQCARTKAGRVRVVRWLKELENGERHGAAASGQAPYDFAWMWKELGLPLGDE